MRQIIVPSNDVVLNASSVGEGEPILFLHGYPDDQRTWEFQTREFKNEFQCISFDLRGFGGSSKPSSVKSYSMESLIRDVDSILAYFKISKPIHLVGHDWGSMIGWLYVSNPELAKKIKSFTAISCPHPVLAKKVLLEHTKSLNVDYLWTQFTKSWYISFFQIPLLPEVLIELFPEVFWKKMLRDGEIPETDPMWKYNKGEIFANSLSPIKLYRNFLIENFPWENVAITTRTQVLVATKDLAISPFLYEGMEAYIPNLSVERLAANHWVHRERWQETNQLLRNFWNR